MIRKDILVNERGSIKETLKKLDKSAKKTLLVVDDKNHLLGTITDGDIRRHILKGNSLDGDISTLYNRTPYCLKKDDFTPEAARKVLIEKKIDLIPIVDTENKLVDFITWMEVFGGEEERGLGKKLDVPLVIMAGGKGSRMEPFSRILPKSLIPIGERPLVEVVMDEFSAKGVGKFYLMLNYKGEMVRSYFDNIDKDYALEYIWEDDFYGTAGSLCLLQGKIEGDFFVSNCDVIVKADFYEVLNLHKEQNASLTILSSVKHYKIPYGVINLKEGGDLSGITEKPEYTFIVNTGVYILNSDVLKIIPEKTCFDMTDLTQRLIQKGKKVRTYPVNESDYIDMGQWEEYKNAVSKLHGS